MRKVLRDLACDDGELSILFTDDRHIAELNRDYLGRNGPTNVLAFPMSGPPATANGRQPQARPPGGIQPMVESGMLGDVVVSVDRAIDESKKLYEPLDETIYRLLIHGILHLLNFDHEGSSEEARRMEQEQARLLSLIREE